MTISEFTPEVAEQIGFYVYRLVDPRSGETFYVGKGKGNRVFQHARGDLSASELEQENEDALSAKLARIGAIRHASGRTGLEVIHVIHRHGLDEATAFEVEAALMDAYPGLSNTQGGHHSGERGSMHALELQAKYGLPELTGCEALKLILININAIEEGLGWDNLYEQVRKSWRLNPDRARQADYVVAVWRGVTKGVYKAETWSALPADEKGQRRYEFSGHEADQEILDLIVGARGKRITHRDMKHNQNPIRYWNI